MGIAIALTNRCPVMCRMCFTNSHMNKEGDMSQENVFRYIDETSELSIENFCIGGGEPFLRFSELKAACNHGAELGLTLSCTTNAYWAQTVDDALRSLKELRECGLNFLNISVDDFHQEHIPLECVGNAVKAAKEIDLEKISLVCTRTSQTRGIRYYTFYLENFMDVDLKGVTLIEDQRIPFGRDGESYPKEDLKPLSSFLGNKDAMICFSLPFIDPFGNFYPCCNYFVGTLGNLNDYTLGAILELAEENENLQTICTQGPVALLQELIEGEKLPKKEEFVCKCHICAYVFSHQSLSRILYVGR